MIKKTIYVLEDEKNIQQLIRFNLENHDYKVYCFTTGKELFINLLNTIPDLLLLDIMLPDTDGYQVLTKLKSQIDYKNIPVIMLTAKNEEFDKVLGLDMGCEDYITKPFSIKELIARIKVVLRRIPNSQDLSYNIFTFLDLEIDISKHEFKKGSNIVELPLKQFRLLEIFIKNPKRVFSRSSLLEQVWGYDYIGETRTVDVHINHLRNNISNNKDEYIQTVIGVGYKLNKKD